MSMSDIDIDVNDIILLNTFLIEGKKCRVYFHNGMLSWDKGTSSRIEDSLPLSNVLSIEYNNERRNTAFTVHYAKKAPKSTWKYYKLTFHHTDPMQVASWAKTLQNLLKSLSKRPKQLLVFVNPYGGKREGLKIYEKYGKPLFQLSSVDVDVLVSQRSNQIRDIILSFDLKRYDGVICVGGDGTFSEVFNGLVLRACHDHGINAHDIEATLPVPALPVGVIPAGSTDTIAYCLHGTNDPETAVLQIIFGDCSRLDLVSVYNEHALLKLYASVISYGYLGDIALDSEKYRWMGPKRYEFTGCQKVILNAGYHAEIALCLENNIATTSDKCTEDCAHCRNTLATITPAAATATTPIQWKTVKGKFFMVSGANISCACSRSPNGIAPYSHIGDGYIHLVLIRHTHIINNLRLLLRLASKNKTLDDLPFVENYRVKEFCFRACSTNMIPGFSQWNCDGEVVYDTDLRIKVRCQLLHVFTRGMQKQLQTATSCCSFMS